LACSHRWFTWPAPRGVPPVGSYPTLSPITCAAKSLSRPSAGLLSVALDVTGGLRRPVPRVLSPSGLSGPEATPPVLASPDFALRPGAKPRRSDGSDGPNPEHILYQAACGLAHSPSRGRGGRSSWGSGALRPCRPGSSGPASAGRPRPPDRTRPPGFPRGPRRARAPPRRTRSL
jgi:hypothetical protein